MGKKSREKRAAAAARAAAAPAQQPVLVLAQPPKPTDAELLAELELALREEAEAARVERLNNLPIGHPENAHKLGLTFDPIEAWFVEQETTGYSEALQDGTVVFKPRGEDEWYPIAESFFAVCDTYELIAKDAGVPDESDGLRRLARKINVNMPLMDSDMKAARAAIDWMKRMTAPLTPKQFSDYSVAIQIRATLVEQGFKIQQDQGDKHG